MKRHLCAIGLLMAAILALAGCGACDCDSAAASPGDVRPLLAGMATPRFTARHADGSEYVFDPRVLERPVILSFYRGGWCPYCNRQLAMLRLIEEDLHALGYEVIFLSADRHELLYPSLEDPEIEYTLLSDQSMEVARLFGVAFTVDDRTLVRYERVGIDLAEASGESHNQLPVPATFIIDRSGTVVFQYANPNYKVRLEPELF